MKYNPKIHNRRSIRLKGYDYSQAGLYFITICVKDRTYLFGNIVGAHPRGRPDKGQPRGHTPTGGNETVGDVVGAFKSITTNEYIDGVKNHGWPRFNGKLWQGNYWEHIIRNEKSYYRISNYIINNPSNWKNDKLYRSFPTTEHD